MRRIAFLSLSLLLVAAACGDDDTGVQTTSPATTAAATTTTAAAAATTTGAAATTAATTTSVAQPTTTVAQTATTVAGVHADPAVWVTNGADKKVFKIDPSSGETLLEIDVDDAPGGVALGAGSAWISSFEADYLLRLDAATGEEQARITIGTEGTGVTFADGVAWVAQFAPGTATARRPAFSRIRRRIPSAMSLLPAVLAPRPMGAAVYGTHHARRFHRRVCLGGQRWAHGFHEPGLWSPRQPFCR